MGKGERRRAELVELSADHLLEVGLPAFSLRSAAAAAGTSHSMLLYHFGSYDALLREVLHEVRRRRLDPLTTLLGHPIDLVEVWRVLCADSAELRVLRQGVSLAQSAPERYAGIAADAHADDMTVVDALLVAGPTDPARREIMGTLLLAGLRGLIMDWLATHDDERIVPAVRELQALVTGSV